MERMKCIKCNKKADYMIDGNSLCTDCKIEKENREIEFMGGVPYSEPIVTPDNRLILDKCPLCGTRLLNQPFPQPIYKIDISRW